MSGRLILLDSHTNLQVQILCKTIKCKSEMQSFCPIQNYIGQTMLFWFWFRILLLLKWSKSGGQWQNYRHLPWSLQLLYFYCYWLSTVRDFLIELYMKPNMHLSRRNKHFFTKYCHHQTYQNYEQSRQKLGTFLENKLRK